MLIKDLTLQDFESFIKEQIFENMEFQYSYDEYLKNYGNDRDLLFDNLFKFRIRRNSINDIYCANLIFGLQIEKTELHQYFSINLELMLKEFVDLMKLEDIKSYDVYFSYCSTDEYSFDFDFTLWLKEE